jgi:hypothetical protein
MRRLVIAFALIFSGCDATFEYTEVTDSAPEDAAPATCVTAGCPPMMSCDVETGLCERCTGSGDCTDPRQPFCQLDIHQCVRCLEAVDCASGETCIEDHCVETCKEPFFACDTPGTRCDLGRGLCVQCTDGFPCMIPSRPKCATSYGRCEECLSDGDCAHHSGHAFCQLSRHFCVECLHSSDCKDPARPLCTSDNRCVTS